MRELQQQLMQAQMRKGIGGHHAAATMEEEEMRFEAETRVAMQLSLTQGGGGAQAASHAPNGLAECAESSTASSSSGSLTTLALAGPACARPRRRRRESAGRRRCRRRFTLQLVPGPGLVNVLW